MEENYRDDLAFKTAGIKKLQRKTLNLADVFNIIFEQLISNDAVLKGEIDAAVREISNCDRIIAYVDDRLSPMQNIFQLTENFTIRDGKLYQILKE